MFIGLMGIKEDGMLITPSGKNICRVHFWLACKIQKIQHWIAKKTWR